MRTVLITGSTSGIGSAFARYFGHFGHRLILVGRRTDRLHEIEAETGAPCRLITADLSKEEVCKQLLTDIQDEEIDLFINNAGFGAAGSFLKTDMDKELSMIRVNDMAMHILFKGILIRMQERGQGRIVNVASSAGLFPGGPYMAAYYASKAYVVSLTKAVARELKEAGSGVYVCALCPGPVDTEFNEHADVVFALKGISANRCVRECLDGMKKRKTIIVPTIKMRLAVSMQRLVPESVLLKIVGRQQKKKIQ